MQCSGDATPLSLDVPGILFGSCQGAVGLLSMLPIAQSLACVVRRDVIHYLDTKKLLQRSSIQTNAKHIVLLASFSACELNERVAHLWFC